jgi:hypothetical protein
LRDAIRASLNSPGSDTLIFWALSAGSCLLFKESFVLWLFRLWEDVSEKYFDGCIVLWLFIWLLVLLFFTITLSYSRWTNRQQHNVAFDEGDLGVGSRLWAVLQWSRHLDSNVTVDEAAHRVVSVGVKHDCHRMIGQAPNAMAKSSSSTRWWRASSSAKLSNIGCVEV